MKINILRLSRSDFLCVCACPRQEALTFAVLAACASRGVAVASELVVRRGLARVGVRGVGLVGEGVHQGPRRSPRERQRGQRVLVRGPAGAVVVIQGEVGHVWEVGWGTKRIYERCKCKIGWNWWIEFFQVSITMYHSNGHISDFILCY